MRAQQACKVWVKPLQYEFQNTRRDSEQFCIEPWKLFGERRCLCHGFHRMPPALCGFGVVLITGLYVEHVMVYHISGICKESSLKLERFVCAALQLKNPNESFDMPANKILCASNSTLRKHAGIGHPTLFMRMMIHRPVRYTIFH